MLPGLMLAGWISPDMFQMNLSLAEKILRPMVVYVFLVVCLRIFGKRELAQLNPFDLVVLLALSNTVQNAIIGEDNSVTGGLIGAFALLTINYVVVRFLFRHRRLDQIFEGTPTMLIQNGILDEDAMARELLTVADLTTVLHRQEFSSIREVETCVLEPGGSFFVQGRVPARSELRHAELTAQIQRLSHQIERLERRLAEERP